MILPVSGRIHPSRIRTVHDPISVDMYEFQPRLSDKSNIEKQKICHGLHVINDGSPSRIRMVRRISLGMTTRPRSSMRRTIPVAFMIELLLFPEGRNCLVCTSIVSAIARQLCSFYQFSRRKELEKGRDMNRGMFSFRFLANFFAA